MSNQYGSAAQVTDDWYDDSSIGIYRLDLHDRDEGSFNNGEIDDSGFQYMWINSYFDVIPDDGCNIPYRYEHTAKPGDAYATVFEDPLPAEGSQSGDEITLDIGPDFYGVSASVFTWTVWNPTSVNADYGSNNTGIYWAIDPDRSSANWPEDEDVDNNSSEHADPDSTQFRIVTNKNPGDTITAQCTGEYTWAHSDSACGTGGGYVYRTTGQISISHSMDVV